MKKLTTFSILICICSCAFISLSCFTIQGKKEQKANSEWIDKTREFSMATCVNDTLFTIIKNFIETEKTCSDLYYSSDSLMVSLKIYKSNNKYILIIKSNEFRADILEEAPLAVTMIDNTPCFIYQDMPVSLFTDSGKKYIFHYKEYKQFHNQRLPIITPEDSPYSTLRYTIYQNGLFHLDAEDRPCFGIYEEYDLLKPELE